MLACGCYADRSEPNLATDVRLAWLGRWRGRIRSLDPRNDGRAARVRAQSIWQRKGGASAPPFGLYSGLESAQLVT